MATILQKRAFQELAEKGRSVSATMRAVGYSPKSATKPSKLTNSKGFQELAAQALSDEKLLRKHDEGLNAEDADGVPDYAVRHKYLETAYKIRGKLKEGGDPNTQINLIFDNSFTKIEPNVIQNPEIVPTNDEVVPTNGNKLYPQN